MMQMYNPIYEAAIEGRYPIDLEVSNENGEYVARYNRHGLNVEERASSSAGAILLANTKVLEGLRDATSFDYLNG